MLPDEATMKLMITPVFTFIAALIALMGILITSWHTTKRLQKQLDHATTLHGDKLANDKREAATARIFAARQDVYADVCAAAVAASNYLSSYGQENLLSPSPATSIFALQASVAKMVVLAEPSTANAGLELASKYGVAHLHLFSESIKLKLAKERMDEVYADKSNTDKQLIDEVFEEHKRLTHAFMDECASALDALTEPQIRLASAMRSDLGVSNLDLTGMEAIMRQAAENLKRGKQTMLAVLEEVEREYS